MTADYTYQSIQVLDTVTRAPATALPVTFRDGNGNVAQTYTMEGLPTTLTTDRHGIVQDFKANVPTGEVQAGGNSVGVFSYEGFASKTYVDQLVTGQASEITDAVIAGYLADSGSQSGTLHASKADADGLPYVNVLDHGAAADGTTDDGPAIRAAIVAAPTGAVVVLPPGRTCHVGDAWVVVDKPLTIRGGKVSLTTGKGFQVTSSDVTFDGVEIEGPGVNGTWGEFDRAAIYVTGTDTAPLERIAVRDCHLHQLAHSGVWAHWVHNFTASGNIVHDFRYGGIMLLSAVDSIVQGNRIHTAWQIAPVVNTYGIAVTDASNDEAGRSRRVVVDSNTVIDISGHEGIDTHGGAEITISNNVVLGCLTGLALLTGNATRVLSPQNLTVTGNVVDGANVAGRYGIIVNGAPTRPVWGAFTGNVVTRCETPWSVYEPDLKLCSWAGNVPEYTPWRPLPLNTGWTSNADYPAEYMVNGDVVEVRGLISRTGTSVSIVGFATIPTEGVPGSRRFFGYNQTSDGGYRYMLLCDKAGLMSGVYAGGTMSSTLSVTYPIDGTYRLA